MLARTENQSTDELNTEAAQLDRPQQTLKVWAGLLGALGGAAVVGWFGLLLHA